MSARARVLVVDDEALNRYMIEAILDSEGYEILHAATGEIALETIAREAIDIVLLDVMMPGIDGIEVCRRIRGELARPMLPVVLISALSDAGSRTRGKQAGADDFLTKPIHQDELVARTHNLILLREYYALGERLRAVAEVEARRWRFVSSVATAVAGCMTYESVTSTLLDHLRIELRATATAYLECQGGALGLISRAPRPEGIAGELAATVACGFAAAERITKAPGGDQARLLAILGVEEALVIPLGDREQALGVFCIGRDVGFSPAEHEMLVALAPHIANGIVNVRSHLRAVEALLVREREREQAQAALRLSEERHRLLFESSPLPIWIVERKGEQIVAVNEAFVKLSGYSRAELAGMTLPDLAPGGTMPPFGGRRVRCSDGGIAELDVTEHDMVLDGAEVRVSIGVDTTQSRWVEEQLRQSQKMEAIGQLAGGVAHDFNNILAAILANAELARETVGERHAALMEIGEIEYAARMGADVTRQLLTFSRKQRREVEVLEIDRVVGRLEKLLTRIVRAHIETSWTLAAGHSTIMSDASQIEQVVMNLVINACDAMPSHGRLAISTADVEVDAALATRLGLTPGSFVTLSVADTGSGMTPVTVARIFEPFFTTKPVGKGTGLGLSTVFGIVKESGGAIVVESEVGRGTTFRIYLPRHGQETTAFPRETAPQPHSPGTETILLVEDNESLRAVVRRQLTGWGYRLIEARSGAHALELLEQPHDPIDLLVTDVVMPGVDGRTLATVLRATRPELKVIFMSGYAEHASVSPDTFSFDSYYIEKPFGSQLLARTIRTALQAPRRRPTSRHPNMMRGASGSSLE